MTADDATLAFLAELEAADTGGPTALGLEPDPFGPAGEPTPEAAAYALRLIRGGDTAPTVVQPGPVLPPPTPTAPAAASPEDDDGKKPHPVTLLRKHFGATCDLIHDHGRPFAVPRESSELLGPAGVAIPFGGELRRQVARVSQLLPGPPVTRTTVDTVLMHLEGDAFRGPATPVALRFHHDPAAARVVIDLARPDGYAVTIDGTGWTVGPPPPGVVFRRSHATLPLPDPVRGGRLDELAGILDLDPDGVPFRALVGWIVGLPFAASVRPGLLLIGGYGYAKTTRLRLGTSVLEPSPASALGSTFGRNVDDDQVRATHRAVPLWDNLTSVTGLISDAFCCLVTGTALEKRSLYSNNELVTVAIARPVGLTAVGVPAGFRPDALDRLIVVEAPPPTARKADAEIQAGFDAAHPRLLGAVCDAVVATLALMPTVPAPGEHRMAAHAHVLAAIDAATRSGYLPGMPGGLLDAYGGLSRLTKQRTAADDTFGSALLALLEAAPGGQWAGRATELLTAASMHAALGDRNTPGWPTSPRRVPEVLGQLRDGLSSLGVAWTTTTARGKTRYAFTLAEEPGGTRGAPAAGGLS